MPRGLIILIIVAACCVALAIYLYFWNKKNEKKRAEQEELIENSSQWVNALIIDKKKIRLTKSGLPQQVIDETPWFARRSKVPVVKAKVGPKITLLVADNNIFDYIPVKKEIKCKLSGIYISDIRAIKGQIEKPAKKKGPLARLMGEK